MDCCTNGKSPHQLVEVVYKSTIRDDYTTRNTHKLHPENSNWKTVYLYFCALSSNLAQMTCGLMFAWISPMSIKLLSNNTQDNPLATPITTMQLSLLGASQPMGTFVGALMVANICDLYGSKRCLTVAYSIMAISMTVVAFSSSITVYYLGLFFCGTTMGAISVVLPIFVGEIAEDHNRSKISCMVCTGCPVGTVLCYLIGSYVSFRCFNSICAVPAALNALCFLFLVPQTPVYLVKTSNPAAARRVLGNVRNKTGKEIGEEIEKIQRDLRETYENHSKSGCTGILTDRCSRNGLVVALGCYILFATSGVSAFTAYLQPIFDAAGSSLSSSTLAVIAAVLQVISYASASASVEKWGTRNTMLYAVSSSCVPLALTGLYFYAKAIDPGTMKGYVWAPVGGLNLFMFLNVMGTATVPLAVMNEVLVDRVKATANAVIVVVSGIAMTLAVFSLPLLMERIGLAWCLWLYSMNCLIGGAFIYFVVPDTRGKSVSEIQEVLFNLFAR
uniref:Major facilitator superfamily protein n=1 Tax=Phyllotreta armoraciae TaxID=1553667 RepID=A0A858Z6W7_9CUCU|nr:major facilitator superfamily protein [Phyllotreta armoraciae]